MWPYQPTLRVSSFLGLFFVFSGPAPAADPGFVPGRAGFEVRLRDEVIPYAVFGVYALPGEILTLEANDRVRKIRYVLRIEAGKVSTVASNKWRWQAPQSAGLYPLTILHPQSLDSISLNVFVMVPYDRLKGEYLNGYRIGSYPLVPLRQMAIYQRPRGFIEVTPENEETLVAPHFRLKQFLSKQESRYPKYMVLGERLLLKLEYLLGKVNERGYRCDTFHIMSGYRTPYHNRVIGNVKYSRHLWGGAADIFIDENPRDGVMDDLNGDGTIDLGDAALLYNLIESLGKTSGYNLYVGGLSTYRSTNAHGPFIHIDVRGYRARW